MSPRLAYDLVGRPIAPVASLDRSQLKLRHQWHRCTLHCLLPYQVLNGLQSSSQFQIWWVLKSYSFGPSIHCSRTEPAFIRLLHWTLVHFLDEINSHFRFFRRYQTFRSENSESSDLSALYSMLTAFLLASFRFFWPFSARMHLKLESMSQLSRNLLQSFADFLQNFSTGKTSVPL